jgi:tetratricopeptide (TPR) repeat protein
VTDALITRLGNLRQIAVRPTGVVLKYQGEGRDIIAAGRTLKVEAVLDGRVQKFGESVRVTMQLVRVSDETVLWTGEVMGKFNDLLALQDSISTQVTRALALHLTGEEQQRLAKRYTENAEAYQAYLRGRYFWNRRGADWTDKAIASFEQAIKIDPNYALAYTGLADTYIILGDHAIWPPKEAFPKARAAAVRALELDETLAGAHTSLALIKSKFDWDWPGAEQEYKRAIELNPGYALAYGWYGGILGNMERFNEALALIKQAQEIDPLSPSLYVYASGTHRRAGQSDQAIAQARKALDLDPDFDTAISQLGLAYEQKGMYEEAITALSRAVSLGLSYKSDLGHAYAVAGRRQEAIKILDELKELSSQRYIRPYGFAILYTGLGENDRAFEWLNKALEDRDPFMSNLAVEPRFNPLRSDPRFTDLVRRIGLEP